MVEIVAQFPQIESKIPKEFTTPAALKKGGKQNKTQKTQSRRKENQKSDSQDMTLNEDKTRSEDQTPSKEKDKPDSNPGTDGQTSG